MGRPRDLGLVALALIAVAPVAARLAGAKIGSFGMFTEFVSFRVAITREAADGTVTPLPLARLAPHLGRDARRVIVPGEVGAYGETQVGLLANGLDDLARLGCAVDPTARRIEVRLQRFRLDGRALPDAQARVACHGDDR